MPYTFSIGYQTFADLASTDGRKALSCKPDAPLQDLKRFHVPGSKGNFLIRGDSAGVRIYTKMRYIGTDVMALFAADKAAWTNTAVTIVATDGTYERCSLDPGGMKIVRDPVAMGDGSARMFMDVEATFTSDAG